MSAERESLLPLLGERVRALREARGWSRRELARQAAMSERHLAGIELGTANVSLLRLFDLGQALSTTPARMLSGLASRRPGEAVPPAVIALLGLRGAGKTTIGKALALRLMRPFFELDALIEQAAGMPTGSIFELHGERWFRRLERETLTRFLLEHPTAVLAAGGGLVTEPETYELLLRKARTVWLKARPGEHWDRVVAQGDRRPMHNRVRAMEELQSLLASRDPLYARAELTVDTSAGDVPETVESLTRALAD